MHVSSGYHLCILHMNESLWLVCQLSHIAKLIVRRYEHLQLPSKIKTSILSAHKIILDDPKKTFSVAGPFCLYNYIGGQSITLEFYSREVRGEVMIPLNIKEYYLGHHRMVGDSLHNHYTDCVFQSLIQFSGNFVSKWLIKHGKSQLQASSPSSTFQHLPIQDPKKS